MKIKIIEDKNKWDFERAVDDAISNKKVVDIKFSVCKDIHSGIGSSYSSGETYYAMIIYDI